MADRRAKGSIEAEALSDIKSAWPFSFNLFSKGKNG